MILFYQMTIIWSQTAFCFYLIVHLFDSGDQNDIMWGRNAETDV